MSHSKYATKLKNRNLHIVLLTYKCLKSGPVWHKEPQTWQICTQPPAPQLDIYTVTGGAYRLVNDEWGQILVCMALRASWGGV